MTAAEITMLAEVMGEHLRGLLTPIRQRLDALEADASKYVRYEGVHQRAQSYRRGAGVTFKGALWVAVADTAATPGTDSSWQMANKSGEASR